jgi:hypothetical protein
VLHFLWQGQGAGWPDRAGQGAGQGGQGPNEE